MPSSTPEGSELAIRSKPLEPGAPSSLFDEATKMEASIQELQTSITEAMSQPGDYGPEVEPRGEHAPVEVNRLRISASSDRKTALSELETATRFLLQGCEDTRLRWAIHHQHYGAEKFDEFKASVVNIQKLVSVEGSGYETAIPANFVEQATASERSLVEKTRDAIFRVALLSKGLPGQVQADTDNVQRWMDAHYAHSKALQHALLPNRPDSEMEIESSSAALVKAWSDLVGVAEATSACTEEEMQAH